MSTPSSSPHLARRAERHRLLGDPARLLIIDAITERPRLTSELTALTGLHRNTVRAHLARLIEAGLLTTERRPPTGPGRPAVRYRLRDRLGLPGAEQGLLIQSLLRLVDGAYRAGGAPPAEQEGYAVGRRLAASTAEPSVERVLSAVVGVLRDLAFAPELSSRNDVNEIALHSCPFAVSPDDPRGGIICAFHLGLIRGIVDTAGPPGKHLVRLLPHVAPDLCRAEIRLVS
ncbi:MAG TPA: helix-turn-helix domain-containing protein [Candidatus Limnocylindria bacterium]|jgi:predicted ArsR family transcriptional regulator|nr:helix-turn-helix domain-containing protein [Candidatus Limnocylindria bacterium]